MLKRWQDFLDSLSTKGGNILVAGFVMAALTFAMHHSHTADMFAVVRDLLVGFGGALLAMLKGDSSRQQMTDRRDSVVLPPPLVQPTPALPSNEGT